MSARLPQGVLTTSFVVLLDVPVLGALGVGTLAGVFAMTSHRVV